MSTNIYPLYECLLRIVFVLQQFSAMPAELPTQFCFPKSLRKKYRKCNPNPLDTLERVQSGDTLHTRRNTQRRDNTTQAEITKTPKCGPDTYKQRKTEHSQNKKLRSRLRSSSRGVRTTTPLLARPHSTPLTSAFPLGSLIDHPSLLSLPRELYRPPLATSPLPVASFVDQMGS